MDATETGSITQASETLVENLNLNTVNFEVEDNIRKSGKDPSAFTREGKVAIYYDRNKKTFYNPTQEVNRDISILGIQTFIEQESGGRKDINILEAMAASGIRSIRYSKEIDSVKEILANDFSLPAVESLKENCDINKTTNVIPNFDDASTLMFKHKSKFFVVDLDPYGSPVPFLESGLQCVSDGGMLLVTATDMAVLAGGNNPEACFSKYGTVSVKSSACQELALRTLIHAVQSCAGRNGKYVEPLLALKIDFYVRIFFKVHHSPVLSKQVALNTSMFYQCSGCHVFHLQPLVIQKGPKHYYGSAKGPPIGPRCNFCESPFHVGGPIWTGLMHNKSFVQAMKENANTDKYEYLGTVRRVQGLLQLVSEELDDPLMYELPELCRVAKCQVMSFVAFRSSLLHLGYKVSSTHTEPNCFKTNAPHEVLWEVILAWRAKTNAKSPVEGTPCFNIVKNMQKSSREISFEPHPDANPPSRENGVLRFQLNPTRNWGPGARHAFDVNKIAEQRKSDEEKSDSEVQDGSVRQKKRRKR